MSRLRHPPHRLWCKRKSRSSRPILLQARVLLRNAIGNSELQWNLSWINLFHRLTVCDSNQMPSNSYTYPLCEPWNVPIQKGHTGETDCENCPHQICHLILIQRKDLLSKVWHGQGKLVVARSERWHRHEGEKIYAYR